MVAENTLRVDPGGMRRAARVVDESAKDFRNRLADVDRRVSALLGGWLGPSGNAYSAAWEQWRRGAGEIQASLSSLARSLEAAAAAFESNEARSARALSEVAGGG